MGQNVWVPRPSRPNHRAHFTGVLQGILTLPSEVPSFDWGGWDSVARNRENRVGSYVLTTESSGVGQWAKLARQGNRCEHENGRNGHNEGGIELLASKVSGNGARAMG